MCQFLCSRSFQSKTGPFRLKPKSGFLTQSKKSFSTGSASPKSQSKTCFEAIASLNPPQHTHPHAHTPIPGTTQQNHTTAPKPSGLLSLMLLLAASQRGAYLTPPTSSVYHTMAAARGIGVISSTTAMPAVKWPVPSWS